MDSRNPGRKSAAEEEDECRAIAEDIQRQRPDWCVIWGCYSRQFWAYAKFNMRRRVIVQAIYPPALIDRMDEAERQLRIYPDQEEGDRE